MSKQLGRGEEMKTTAWANSCRSEEEDDDSFCEQLFFDEVEEDSFREQLLETIHLLRSDIVNIYYY